MAFSLTRGEADGSLFVFLHFDHILPSILGPFLCFWRPGRYLDQDLD